MGRGVSTAAVYKFNGQTCEKVLDGSPYHECQALLSSTFNGYLYATFGQGFKINEGSSRMWATLDGGEWLSAGTFEDCPNLYVMLDTPYGYVCAGGQEGHLRAYHFPTEIKPEPKLNKCPKCGWAW